jgi:ABC-type Fe3+ transport system permease subunit
VLIVGAALRAVEAEIEEDAATCTAPQRVLWHISLRRAAPSIVLAGVWVAIMGTTEIAVTDFFQVRTFAEEVYTQSALGTFDASGQLPALSAVGLWSGLLLSTFLAVVTIVAAGRLLADLADVPHRTPWIWRLKRWRWPIAILLWTSMFLLAAVPLGNLLFKAGIRVTATETGRIRTWSASKALERLAAAPNEFRGEIWLSARIGAAAATAALAVALPLAWSMRRGKGDGNLLPERPVACFAQKTPAPFFAAVPFFAARPPWLRLVAVALCLTIPGPLLGIFAIRVLNRPPDSPLAVLAQLYDSNFAPWLVQTIRAIPLATLVLWPALASVPQVMLDTAATDGTGWWGRLFRIALPQRWPAAAAAWLIGFAVAFGELGATILVMPPRRGATALSIQIFQMLHTGVDDRVAAICLVTAFAITALTGIAAALLQRRM